MHRGAIFGALSGAVVLVIGAIAIGLPYLTKDRTYPASIPQPPSVVATELVAMKPRQVVCLHDAVLDTHSQRALFQVETYGKPTVPLHLALTGNGYRANVDIPGSAYKDEGFVNVGVPKPRRDVLVQACVTNVGARPAALFATTAAEPGPVTATRDGESVGTNPWLAFYEAKRTSIAKRLPTIVSRIGVFRPPIIGSWLLWPLALLFVLGVPAALLAAYARGLSEDERMAQADDQRSRSRLTRRSGSVKRHDTDA